MAKHLSIECSPKSIDVGSNVKLTFDASISTDTLEDDTTYTLWVKLPTGLEVTNQKPMLSLGGGPVAEITTSTWTGRETGGGSSSEPPVEKDISSYTKTLALHAVKGKDLLAVNKHYPRFEVTISCVATDMGQKEIKAYLLPLEEDEDYQATNSIFVTAPKVEVTDVEITSPTPSSVYKDANNIPTIGQRSVTLKIKLSQSANNREVYFKVNPGDSPTQYQAGKDNTITVTIHGLHNTNNYNFSASLDGRTWTGANRSYDINVDDSIPIIENPVAIFTTSGLKFTGTIKRPSAHILTKLFLSNDTKGNGPVEISFKDTGTGAEFNLTNCDLDYKKLGNILAAPVYIFTENFFGVASDPTPLVADIHSILSAKWVTPAAEQTGNMSASPVLGDEQLTYTIEVKVGKGIPLPPFTFELDQKEHKKVYSISLDAVKDGANASVSTGDFSDSSKSIAATTDAEKFSLAGIFNWRQLSANNQAAYQEADAKSPLVEIKIRGNNIVAQSLTVAGPPTFRAVPDFILPATAADPDFADASIDSVTRELAVAYAKLIYNKVIFKIRHGKIMKDVSSTPSAPMKSLSRDGLNIFLLTFPTGIDDGDFFQILAYYEDEQHRPELITNAGGLSDMFKLSIKSRPPQLLAVDGSIGLDSNSVAAITITGRCQFDADALPSASVLWFKDSDVSDPLELIQGAGVYTFTKTVQLPELVRRITGKNGYFAPQIHLKNENTSAVTSSSIIISAGVEHLFSVANKQWVGSGNPPHKLSVTFTPILPIGRMVLGINSTNTSFETHAAIETNPQKNIYLQDWKGSGEALSWDDINPNTPLTITLAVHDFKTTSLVTYRALAIYDGTEGINKVTTAIFTIIKETLT